MPMKTTGLIFIVVGSLVLSSSATPLKSEADTKKLADNFMQLVGKGSYSEAFNLMKPEWPLPVAEIDNLEYKTESQLKMAAERFGKLVGYEYIQSNRIGESYVRYVYIQKFTKHATRWMVVFYRPLDEWKINLIVWDDKPHTLFELNSESSGGVNGASPRRAP